MRAKPRRTRRRLRQRLSVRRRPSAAPARSSSIRSGCASRARRREGARRARRILDCLARAPMIGSCRGESADRGASGEFMLSVYVPRGTSLAAHRGRSRRAAAGGRGLDRPRHADPAGRQAGRAHARHRGADARGDAGDRGLQPPLCRERRALHDRDADVPLRHRDAEDHAGHLHPRRPPPGHRALRRAAPLRHRRAQARPRCARPRSPARPC